MKLRHKLDFIFCGANGTMAIIFAFYGNLSWALFSLVLAGLGWFLGNFNEENN